MPLLLKAMFLPSGISDDLISVLDMADTSAEALLLETDWETTFLAAYVTPTITVAFTKSEKPFLACCCLLKTLYYLNLHSVDREVRHFDICMGIMNRGRHIKTHGDDQRLAQVWLPSNCWHRKGRFTSTTGTSRHHMACTRGCRVPTNPRNMANRTGANGPQWAVQAVGS